MKLVKFFARVLVAELHGSFLASFLLARDLVERLIEEDNVVSHFFGQSICTEDSEDDQKR